MKVGLATVTPSVKARPALGALVAVLASCATYHAIPLDTDAVTLAPPVAAVLSEATSAIQRPYLQPAPVNLVAPLDPNAIALITLVRNPELEAMRVRAGVADAQLFDARLMPDPSLSLSAELVTSGPASAASGTYGTQLVQDINALRTRRARIEAAGSTQRQVRLDVAWSEWQTTGAARLEAIRLVHLQRIADLARANQHSAQDLLERSLRAAGRGDLSPDQLTTTRLSYLDAVDRAQQANIALSKSRAELHRLTGLPPGWPLQIAGSSLPSPPPKLRALFEIARSQRLDLAALRAGYASEEAQVRQAIINQFPTLNIGIAASRDNSNNGFLGPVVDFTLPLWNRNQGKIAIERATRAALKAEYENRLFQTRAELAAVSDNLTELYRQRGDIAPEIPALEKYVATAQRAAARGDLAVATAIAAAQSLRDKQLLLTGIEEGIAEQSVALELLTGVPRESWNP